MNLATAETVIASAEKRLDAALQAFRRQLEGDAEYRRELYEDALLNVMSRHDPGPPPEARKRLRPNWAWLIRMKGRMG